MQLTHVHVELLFDRFTYDIPINTVDGITIITAPNGYGKTVVLNLITNFFRKKFALIQRAEFKILELTFTDGRTISVHNRRELGQATDQKSTRDEGDLIFNARGVGELFSEPYVFSWNRLTAGRVVTGRIDRLMPWLTRVGPDHWMDDRTSRTYTSAELPEILSDAAHIELFKSEKLPRWLEETIESIECHLVETQRLLQIDLEPDRYTRKSKGMRSVVETNAELLSKRVGEVLQIYANEAQKLDQTFPLRVLRRGYVKIPSELEIKKELAELEDKRSKLVAAGLLGPSPAQQILPSDDVSENIRSILDVYVSDTKKKLGVFDDMYRRISSFQEIVNGHLFRKVVSVDPAKGMSIIDTDNGKTIPLNALSSGEQHELVLVYELLFNVGVNAMILIDEPELSLHVAWQTRFIHDLQQIQRVRPLTIVLATHSPQIIADRWDLMVELGLQTDAPV